MVRQELGIPTVKWNYDQSAVVAVLHLSEVSFATCVDINMQYHFYFVIVFMICTQYIEELLNKLDRLTSVFTKMFF